MFSFRCHNCGKAYTVKHEHAGKTIKCPGCKTAIVLPTAMSPVTPLRTQAHLPKAALVKQGPDVALILTAVLFGLPLLACGGCLGLALVFAPSKEVSDRMRVEQEARNAEVAKAKAAEQTARNTEVEKQRQALEKEKKGLGVTLKAYYSIKTGMTYDEVYGIIGRHGVEASKIDFGGETMQVMEWSGGGLLGGTVILQFDNGKVMARSQFGLH